VNCDQRRDLMLSFALGDLEQGERVDLTEHLRAGCPTCESAWREAEATIALIPMGLRPVEPPKSVKERLMAEIDRDLRRRAGEATDPAGVQIIADLRAPGVSATSPADCGSWPRLAAQLLPWILVACLLALWLQSRQDFASLEKHLQDAHGVPAKP